MERFINATLSFTFGWTKTEVFEYANVIRYITTGAPSYFYRFIVFMWTGEIELSTLHADAYFLRKKKIISSFENMWISLERAQLHGHCRNLVYTVYTLRTSHAKKFYLLNPPIMTSLITFAIFSVSFSASPCFYSRRGVSETSSSTLRGLFCTSRR